MLTVQAARPGGPDVLQAVDCPLPEPGPGQVRIAHRAIGVNFIDTYHRSGLYPLALPAVLGQEAAGVVDALGAGVTALKLGDRVAYCGQTGAYAEAAVVAADRVVTLPPSISFDAAAAGLLKGMTSEFLLRRCYAVQPGDPILVNAAAGGVGMLMSQWARALGALVIGAVGSEAKAAFAKAHGCDHVILYREEDVAARVREITDGQGVRAAYDGVGAATIEASLASLGRRGVLVVFGNASGPPPAIEPARLQRGGSLYLTRPTLFDYIATTEELAASAQALFHVIETGAVKIEIGQRFPLREARGAHEALENRQTTGATVLIP
jgi:NADPH2:quinone reductase